MRKQLLVIVISILIMANATIAQLTHLDPPWNTPLAGGVNFTVRGIDNLPDIW